MKKKLTPIGPALCNVYFFSMMFAVPYFNWRYAKEHGFVRWILFGEVIATAESLIWPYYAVVGFGPRGSRAGANTDEHFANSRRDSSEALSLIARFGGLTELPPEQSAVVARLLQAAVSQAELVDDSYLRQIHPEFLRRFRDEYTGSLRDLADALRASDRVKQDSAAVAYNNFSDWMSAHAKELKFP